MIKLRENIARQRVVELLADCAQAPVTSKENNLAIYHVEGRSREVLQEFLERDKTLEHFAVFSRSNERYMIVQSHLDLLFICFDSEVGKWFDQLYRQLDDLQTRITQKQLTLSR